MLWVSQGWLSSGDSIPLQELTNSEHQEFAELAHSHQYTSASTMYDMDCVQEVRACYMHVWV